MSVSQVTALLIVYLIPQAFICGATFEGQDIGYWLAELSRPTKEGNRDKAKTAIVNITSNSPSSLVGELLAHDGNLKRKVIDELKDQKLIPVRIDSAFERWERTMTAYRLLRQQLKPTVPLLIKAVETGDQPYRLKALKALQCIGGAASEAIPSLCTALSDPDLSVQKSAAETIGSMNEAAAPALPAFFRLLDDNSIDVDLRIQIVKAVGEIGEAAAPLFPSLLKRLASPNRDLQRETLKAFATFGSAARPAIPTIISFLDNNQPSIRDAARHTLEELAAVLDEGETAQLIGMLDTGNDDRSKAILEILQPAYNLSDQGVPQLVEFWKASSQKKDISRPVQRLVEKIGSKRGSSIGSNLLDEIKSPVSPIRVAAIESLGRLGLRNGEAARELEAVLAAGGDTNLRIAAAGTLGVVAPGSTRAVEVLTEEYEKANTPTHDDLEVRLKVLEAFSYFENPSESAIAFLIQVLQESDPSLRSAAAGDLGLFGKASRAAVPPLIAGLKEPDTHFHGNVLGALWMIHEQPSVAVPALMEHLRNEPECRSDTIRALGAYGPSAGAAVPLLLSILQDARNRVGVYAKVQISRGWMEDPAEGVKHSIARALGRIGVRSDEVVPLLTELLKDKDSNVQERSAIALGWFGSKAKSAVPELTKISEKDKGGNGMAARIALLMIEPVDSRTVDALVKIVTRYRYHDGNPSLFAVEALGRLGKSADRALPFLEDLANCSSIGLKIRARDAIERIKTNDQQR